MEEKKKIKDNENSTDKRKLNYSAYYSDIIVKEQPFYRKTAEADEKNKAKSNYSSDVYETRYVSMKNQDWFK